MIVLLALVIVGLIEHWPAWLNVLFAYLVGHAVASPGRGKDVA